MPMGRANSRGIDWWTAHASFVERTRALLTPFVGACARYYCDYCDIYIQFDSYTVRKQHNAGFNHKVDARALLLFAESVVLSFHCLNAHRPVPAGERKGVLHPIHQRLWGWHRPHRPGCM